MSQRLFNLSPDLKKLRDEGFNLEARSGFLLVRGVPYVNSRREVSRGVLIMELTLAGDVTTKPATHMAHFDGDHPCDEHGAPIAKIRNASEAKSLASDVAIKHSFSAKPQVSGAYADYYEKVTTYVQVISVPALKLDPYITARTFPPIEPDADDLGPFNYVDTSSSRSEIVPISEKLRMSKVTVVGLGGTGSYVLDLLAKTPVGQIHLFDGDRYLQHNAFRSPGAPSLEELNQTPFKVSYLKGIYAKMHRGIVEHPYYLNSANVRELAEADFVFLCMDSGEAKRLVVDSLESFGKPFIDVGLGVSQSDGVLGGIVRVTTSTPEKRDHFRDWVSFKDAAKDNEYKSNIQIADLNCLNAALAVIRWKKFCGFYRDFKAEHHSQYTIEGGLLIHEARKA